MLETTPFDDADDLSANHLDAGDRAMIVDTLVDEVRELFHGYVKGDVPFDELTFEMFDTLQTLHAITHGSATLEYEASDNLDDVDGHHDSPGPGANGRTEPGHERAK